MTPGAWQRQRVRAGRSLLESAASGRGAKPRRTANRTEHRARGVRRFGTWLLPMSAPCTCASSMRSMISRDSCSASPRRCWSRCARRPRPSRRRGRAGSVCPRREHRVVGARDDLDARDRLAGIDERVDVRELERRRGRALERGLLDDEIGPREEARRTAVRLTGLALPANLRVHREVGGELDRAAVAVARAPRDRVALRDRGARRVLQNGRLGDVLLGTWVRAGELDLGPHPSERSGGDADLRVRLTRCASEQRDERRPHEHRTPRLDRALTTRHG